MCGGVRCGKKGYGIGRDRKRTTEQGEADRKSCRIDNWRKGDGRLEKMREKSERGGKG